MKHTKTKGRKQIILMWPLLAVILVSLLISGGGSAQFIGTADTPHPTLTPARASVFRIISAPTRTPTAAAMPSQTFTPTPASLMTIKIISYNVLFGAGVDSKYDELLPPELRNQNRVPEFVSLIEKTEPDILGVQEANGWDAGDPSIAQQIADQLDMNYYLAEAPNDFNVVLFTKFEILEAENLSGTEGDPIFETMRALRATLLAPDERFLNVFVVHFDPFSSRVRLYQLDAIIEKMEPYKEQKTILLGDMNFCIDWLEYATLERAGWRNVAAATDVDQIWIPASLNSTSTPLLRLGNFAIGLSDHLPVGADVRIYPAWTIIPTAIPSPQPDKLVAEEDC